MGDLAGANGNWPAEDGTVKDESVKFAVFTAGVGAGRKITKKRFVEFAASEMGGENFGINANGYGAEALCMEETNEFARVALPDGEESGHANASEVFFAVGAQVLEEDVAKRHLSNTLIVKDAQRLLHAPFVDEIDALRRDTNFV